MSSTLLQGSWVRQTPEEGQRTYQSKHCGNNKDEDNSPKIIDKKSLGGFQCSSGPEWKNKKWKDRQILQSCQRAEKAVDHEDDNKYS